MSPAPVRIELLGPLRVSSEDRVITRFRTQKTAALLGLMAHSAPRLFRREELVDLFWPEASLQAGRNQLRVALTSLRGILDAGAGAPIVLADRTHAQLDPARFTTDRAEFERLTDAAGREPDDYIRITLLQKAVALYRGDFLCDQDEPWVTGERLRAADGYALAMRRLVRAYANTRQYEQAVSWAHRLLEIDPIDEEAHRALMQLYAASRQPALALRQYRLLERRLAEEGSGMPAPATRQLRERLETPPVSPPPTPPPVAPTPPPLPAPLTSFVGREAEVKRICSVLTDPAVRLLTLTGPGGSGKTRLALTASASLVAEFGGRVWLVPLESTPSPDLIWETLATAIRLPDSPGGRQAQIFTALGEGQTLLMLDGFESLCEAGAPVVKALLEVCPELRCLVTSRQRLGLSGEHEQGVAPLEVPPPRGTLDELRANPSVQLFTARAAAARPGFAVTEANAVAVRSLCRGLEGIPLAIELAASWAATLSPAEMAHRLNSRFSLLVSRNRDVPPGHRSLQATLDASYELLDEPVRRLFQGLSVFRGGWMIDAAQTVCGESEALTLLADLQDRSLVEARETGAGMRYTWLETVREYASICLPPQDRAAREQAHRSYYLSLAEDSVSRLRGTDAPDCLAALSQEADNFRAALGYAYTTPEEGARLACALYRFWYVRGAYEEGGAAFHRFLHHPVLLPDRLRIRLLGCAGNLAFFLNDLHGARELFSECLERLRGGNEPGRIAAALDSLGNIVRNQGQLGEARPLIEESISLFRQIGDVAGLAAAVGNLALLTEDEGQYAEAVPLHEESLAHYRAAGDVTHVAFKLNHLAELQLRSGAPLHRVSALVAESVAISVALDSGWMLAYSLENAARLLAQQGRWPDAAQLIGAAEGLREAVSVRHSQRDLAVYRCFRSEVEAVLGSEQFALSIASGRPLTCMEAAEAARKACASLNT